MGHSPSGGCHRLKATQLWCLNTTAGRWGETGGMQAQDKNKEQCNSSYGWGCLDAWRSSERTRGCCYRALCSGSEKTSPWVIISWWRVGLGHPIVIRKWVLLSWSISWSPKIANRGFYRRLGSLTSGRRPPHGDARNLGDFWRVGRKKKVLDWPTGAILSWIWCCTCILTHPCSLKRALRFLEGDSKDTTVNT